MTMAREECESVGEIIHDLINPVLARLYAISQDHQWLLPAKREAVGRLLGGIDAAWTVYWNELYGGGRMPQFTECGQIRIDDNGPTPADIAKFVDLLAGEVQNDVG
jgi:hypothetical protein